ncbi:MAG: RNA polymerase sigma factor [Pseudomonadota bacterium]
MTVAEVELIKRAQRGERDAFRLLVQMHYPTLFGFACKYCGNRQDAEDVAQQACIKLARNLGQFRHESAFTTWLYQLVINCARDWHKHERRHAHDEPQDYAIQDEAEPAVMLDQVLSLVSQMGNGFRETLTLVMGEGLTHAEAASILAVKESTVSWRIHEIRKRLNAEVDSGVSV